MPLYGWKCSKCEHLVEVFRNMKNNWDAPCEDEVEDSSCEHTFEKQMQFPMVLRKSYLDGQRGKGSSKESQTWDRMKKAADLEVDKASTKWGSEERKNLTAEIKKLKNEPVKK